MAVSPDDRLDEGLPTILSLSLLKKLIVVGEFVRGRSRCRRDARELRATRTASSAWFPKKWL